MVLPILAAGSVGSTLLIILALILLFHVLKVEETFMIIIGVVLLGYISTTRK